MNPRFAGLSVQQAVHWATVPLVLMSANAFWPNELAQNTAGWSAQDSHEGLTVVAQPWTDPALYKQRFPKRSPLTAGIAAIHVTFQNDSADTLRVNLERIRLLVTLSEDSRQDIATLSPEEVADRTVTVHPSDPTARRPRLPIPGGGPKVGRSKEWSDLEKAARDAGVTGSIIPPHGKVQGLLFFDLANQLDLLSTAHLYIPEVVSIEKNKTLFFFDIDLSKRISR